ncbi:MAG: hypothetical protein NTY14_07780, partial [Candidatus Omnitrophica bacterium]|nr:hypothetical protein [Candidatus Omnitrophota bacterium]
MENSSLTLATEPARVQVIFLVVPICQASAPLGAVMVKAPLMVNVALETSSTVASLVSRILTLKFAPIASGMV